MSLILEKLDNNLEDAQYVNNSTRYTTHLENLLPHSHSGHHQSHGASPMSAGKRSSTGGGGGRRDKAEGGGGGSAGTGTGDALEDIITSTKITLTVPDSMIGNILGKKVRSIVYWDNI